jgi:hemerythrin-like metal-binding protein
MAFLECTDAFLVGDGTMDADHRRIVALINEIADIVAATTDVAAVCEAIARLIDATDEHFTREEALMRETGDPDAIAHAREHGTLLTQIKILATLIGDGTLEVGIDILRFFRGCLVRHVRTHDHALAGHLAATAAASATAPATAPGAVRTPGGRTRAA